ncbi:MAG: FAD-dependent 5-carboxymethylaminomethyl-2-thiouridine(34) oxidoreductase MnmC [Telluria sp.]
MTLPAHFTVLDAHYSAQRLQQRIGAYRGRAGKLHIIALDRSLLPGVHRMVSDDPSVTVDRVSATLAAFVPELSARLDALHLDDIADEGAGWMRTLAKLCAPGARLHAAGLTAAQAKGFHEVGFRFEDNGADAEYMGRKPQPATAPPRERRAVILGAGLAGCAAAQRLCARGWEVALVERHPQPATEASGNHAGIFMPLLSRDDNISTRLTRAAFLFALRYWDHLGNQFLGERCGVLQIARDAAHARVQRSIAEYWHYPPDYARWLEREEATALLGHPAPEGGWLFPQAGWARPSSVCEAMLASCGEGLRRRFHAGTVRLERAQDGWRVLAEDGTELERCATVIVANGAGATQLAQTSPLPLARVRGQVTHLGTDSAPSLPLVVCREAYMTPPVEGLVSTGATYDDIADPVLLASSQHENIRKARALLDEPALGTNAPLAGRVGFRCIPPDRLPLAGALPDYDACPARLERLRDVPRHPGLYGLLGYASRGLIWAPWAAEVLAAELEGEPPPLEAKLRHAIDPARFLLARERGRRR